ncbi:phage tail tape measure protein [Desulfurispora thermophila]|uniref:phage tail tape measure protein n=1 Tax=Desulfurispora thermophila TaxID=265470 RepID=UPI00035CE702|nr:phage tail tape measure protein [Desulfurispora thermophila]
MNTSFSVALILTAYNNMAGALRSAAAQVESLGRTIQNVKQQVSGGLFSDQWFNNAINNVKQAQETMEKWRSSGTADIAEGMAMIAPVEQVVRKASELEDVLQDIRANIYETTMPADQLNNLMQQVQEKALQLGAATRNSGAEAGQTMLTLIKGGMNLQTVLEGGAEAALYLAQAAKIPPEFSAEAIIKIGNAFKVAGKDMVGVADILSRIDAASTASVPSLLAGMTYVSGTAAQLGLTVKETAAALAVLNNRGMEGSIAGTSLNQMLLRLTPASKEAAKALEKIGINFQRDFFDASGKAKPLLDIINVLRKHLQGLPENVKMDILTNIFGVEGARAAIALIQEGEGSIEDINRQYEKAIPLMERIRMMQETFAAKFENMMGSVENFMSAAGTPFMNAIKGYIDRITDILNVLTDWIKANPQVAKGIAQVLVALGGFRILTGMGKIFASFFFSPLLSFAKTSLVVGRSLKGFWDAFNYFRQGAGIFRALWGAIAFGHPTLTRIGLLVSRLGNAFITAGRFAGQLGLSIIRATAQGLATFGRWALQGITIAGRFGLTLLRLAAQALIAAARMAMAWLIGLGPVGWIILGVTAIIAGAIAAWKTNFLGFRDWLIRVWQTIRESAGKAWDGIRDAAAAAMEWLSSLPGKALEWGRNLINSFAEGIRQRIAAIPEALKGAAEKIKAWLGFSSPTEEGPGRYADRWAPNFIRMYASGLMAGAGQIAAAMNYITRSFAAPLLSPTLAVAAAGAAATVRPMLTPAGGTVGPGVFNASERVNFSVTIQNITIEGSGKPDYDARRLAERLGPELERWFEMRAKYKKSRGPRGV